MTSKKNEFLIYEGEMLEEMLFIKDGRISFEAAINLDDPSISIKKYFYEKFSEFNIKKEKQIRLKQKLQRLSNRWFTSKILTI